MELTRIDHIGIAVADLDAAIERYTTAFGLAVVSIETNDDQGAREAMLLPATAGTASGIESYVQLFEPLGGDTPVGRFLARRGEGLHHIGYAVDDIESALQTLAAQGVQLIDTHPRPGARGTSIAFAHPRGLHGVLTELVQAAGA